MKKVIMTLLVISGLCFTQTGVVSDGGMGVWLNARVMSIDSDVNDYMDPAYTLSFDYMTDMGLEIGVDYWVDVHGLDDYNPMDLGLTYHMKGEGMSWAFGLTLHDFTDDSDLGLDTNSVHGGGYTDSNLWFSLAYNLDYDDNETSIAFGKLWSMDSMTLGAGYTANTSDLDMGWLTMSVGTTF